MAGIRSVDHTPGMQARFSIVKLSDGRQVRAAEPSTMQALFDPNDYPYFGRPTAV
jgi:hypothetical protein